MYCPKCGELLELQSDGGLACEPGAMPLSRSLERRMKECFVERTRTPSSAPLPFPVGGSWCCPGCGVAMSEPEPGLVLCTTCGLSLGEFIRELVELHPHREASLG